MKRFVFCCCVLGLVLPAGSFAQEVIDEWSEEDDYRAYFGDDGEDDAPGPADLTEALKEGRGYRIGRSGKYAGKRVAGQSQIHTVQDGDTLWTISQQYYEDPWQWPRLWSYNPEITNPHWIYPLDHVRLSEDALKDDAAVAAMAGEGGAGGGLPAAARTRAPQRAMKPGTVFLRDQGYLDEDALKNVGTLVAAKEEQMLLTATDDVYVKFEEGADVKAGQEYAIFRAMKADERASAEKGKLVRIFGTVTIRSYDRDKGVARGVVSEALDPIERGFNVAQVPRHFELVAPKRNEANVVAKVVASVRPRQLLSFNDVVFLDVGAESGVVPGNRFFVVRRGDEYIEAVRGDANKHAGIVPLPAYDPESLPKEVVGELRVITVREHTTAALVTRSDVDIMTGDVAEMRVGF